MAAARDVGLPQSPQTRWRPVYVGRENVRVQVAHGRLEYTDEWKAPVVNGRNPGRLVFRRPGRLERHRPGLRQPARPFGLADLSLKPARKLSVPLQSGLRPPRRRIGIPLAPRDGRERSTMEGAGRRNDLTEKMITDRWPGQLGQILLVRNDDPNVAVDMLRLGSSGVVSFSALTV